MKKNIFIILGVVCTISACQKPLLNQNIADYEKKCIAEGHEKGSPLFSQCVQKYFYVDEDKLNEERYAADN